MRNEFDFAYKSGLSLFNDKPDYPSVRRRPLLFELSSAPIAEPLNREDELLTKFLDIINKRQINLPIIDRSPYWLKGQSYNPLEVFGTSIQFIDQHTGSLPQTTLPPVEDMELFINTILQEDGPVTIDRQFEHLLNITNNHVIGAANIGMLATRLMSRFSDLRAYPELIIDNTIITPDSTDEAIEPILRKWFYKMAPFETYIDKSGRNDASGDQYYFWTHFFAACVYDPQLPQGQVFQRTFEKGNRLMIYVKENIAKRGVVVTQHFESALLGRHVGLSLVNDDINDSLLIDL